MLHTRFIAERIHNRTAFLQSNCKAKPRMSDLRGQPQLLGSRLCKAISTYVWLTRFALSFSYSRETYVENSRIFLLGLHQSSGMRMRQLGISFIGCHWRIQKVCFGHWGGGGHTSQKALPNAPNPHPTPRHPDLSVTDLDAWRNNFLQAVEINENTYRNISKQLRNSIHVFNHGNYCWPHNAVAIKLNPAQLSPGKPLILALFLSLVPFFILACD